MGYLVRIPIMEGEILFAFEEMEQFKSRDLETRLTTWQRIPGLSEEPFSARLNILSLSNRESYRRNLDDAFGKGSWTTLLNRACSTIEAYWRKRERSIDFTEIKEQEATAFICPPLLVRGANIVFGQGDTGKTWLGLAMARAHVTGDAVLDMDWESVGPALYIDYEADAATLAQRCQMLGGRPRGLRYWDSEGVPLTDQVPALRNEVRKQGISFIVIDSAGLACGGEPEKAESAIKYFNALKAIGVASLTIAHVTKGGDKDNQPFGSNYWFTSARQIWRAQGEQQEGSAVRDLGLHHTKWNNVSRRERPIGVRISSEEGVVSLERCDYGDLFEEAVPLHERVGKMLLRNGEMTVFELAGALDKPAATVRALLNQRVRGAVQVGKGEDGSVKWRIQANEA